MLIAFACSLCGCMAANIVANVLPDAIDLGKTIIGDDYKVSTSKAKFAYFDEKEQVIQPPFRNYFMLLSKKQEYIGFAVSESTNSEDCFTGVRFYKDSIDSDIILLNQFIDWSKQNPNETMAQNIQLKIDSKKTVNLSFTIDKDNKTPLLVYSGKNCDFFAKTKYYALTADNAEKIISEINDWKKEISN